MTAPRCTTAGRGASCSRWRRAAAFLACRWPAACGTHVRGGRDVGFGTSSEWTSPARKAVGVATCRGRRVKTPWLAAALRTALQATRRIRARARHTPLPRPDRRRPQLLMPMPMPRLDGLMVVVNDRIHRRPPDRVRRKPRAQSGDGARALRACDRRRRRLSAHRCERFQVPCNRCAFRCVVVLRRSAHRFGLRPASPRSGRCFLRSFAHSALCSAGNAPPGGGASIVFCSFVPPARDVLLMHGIHRCRHARAAERL